MLFHLDKITKLENGNMEMTQGNLSKTVKFSVLTFEGIAYEKGIKFDYYIDDNIFMKMNENALKQVVEILLDNVLNSNAIGTMINGIGAKHIKWAFVMEAGTNGTLTVEGNVVIRRCIH